MKPVCTVEKLLGLEKDIAEENDSSGGNVVVGIRIKEKVRLYFLDNTDDTKNTRKMESILNLHKMYKIFLHEERYEEYHRLIEFTLKRLVYEEHFTIKMGGVILNNHAKYEMKKFVLNRCKEFIVCLKSL